MSDREKVINDLQRQIEELEERLAIALEGQPEKEQEPYISKETRLNRDEYCRVGDVLDCFDGMDMKADEVFHAVCLIEWAMSKRSVPLDQLLKEQEVVEPKTIPGELKQKMWNALYAEEDEYEKKFVGKEEHLNWFTVYRPWLQKGFDIAINAIADWEGR